MDVSRHWLWLPVVVLMLAVVVSIGQQLWWGQHSFRARFDQVEAGMSDTQVQQLLGPPGRYRSNRVPQVSWYAEVWRLRDGEFVCREYRGQEVHTRTDVAGVRFSVWTMEECVVIVEFDEDGGVCGKVWLTE